MPTLNTRIKSKYDTLANWSTANPVLLAGEVAVVAIPTDSESTVGQVTKPAIVFKVGDGTTEFNTLPYASGLAADVYSWAKAATKPSYTAGEVDADASGTAAGLIGELDVTDSAVSGQYVSAVSQVDGKIQVTRASLPTVEIPEYTLQAGDDEGTIELLKDGVVVGTAVEVTDWTKLVTTDTTQTISGSKIFNDSLKVQSSTEISNYLTLSPVSISMRDVEVPKGLNIGVDSIESVSEYSQGGTQILKFQTENMSVGDTATLTLPTKSGTIALTSDIPDTSNFLTTDTAQDITALKTFQQVGAAFQKYGDTIVLQPTDEYLYSGTTYAYLPHKTGTIALTSDLPDTSKFLTTDTAQEITATKTFKNSPLSMQLNETGITFFAYADNVKLQIEDNYQYTGSNTIILPRKDGTLATLDDISTTVKSILKAAFPVGTTVMSPTDPAEFIGGSWKKETAGKFFRTSLSETDEITDGGSTTHRHNFRIASPFWYGTQVGDNYEGPNVKFGAYKYSTGEYAGNTGTLGGSEDSYYRVKRNTAIQQNLMDVDTAVKYSTGDTDTANTLPTYKNRIFWTRIN